MDLKPVNISTNDFDLIYSDMKEQFPASELKSCECFNQLLESGKYKVFKAIDDNQIVGYVVIAEVEDIIWLDYVAVLKEFHSKGYGSKILTALKDLYNYKSGCILEVECPNHEEPNTLRRIKFYENLGAEKQPIEYYYPNTDGCIKLDLYMIKYKERLNIDYNDTIRKVFELLHSDIPHCKDVFSRIVIQ